MDVNTPILVFKFILDFIFILGLHCFLSLHSVMQLRRRGQDFVLPNIEYELNLVSGF